MGEGSAGGVEDSVKTGVEVDFWVSVGVEISSENLVVAEKTVGSSVEVRDDTTVVVRLDVWFVTGVTRGVMFAGVEVIGMVGVKVE